MKPAKEYHMLPKKPKGQRIHIKNDAVRIFSRLYPRSIILLIFFSLMLINSFAQFRKYSNEFLNIGAGARGLAMGNAQVAAVNDVSAGYWNPSRLLEVKDHPQLSLMHADYFAGIAKYDYAAIALPVDNNKRTLGFSMLRFAVDDIPNTLFLVEPDGSINYNNIQTFSSADYAFLFSYAQTFKKIKGYQVDLGGNAKIIYRKVGSFAHALGFGIDASASINGKNWRASVVARDITTTFNAWSFKFTDREKQALYLTKNDIPVNSTEMTAPRLIFGGAYNYDINKDFNVMGEADLDFTFDGKRNTLISSAISIDPHLGVEAGYLKQFFVRAGVTNFQRALADADTLNQRRVWIFQPCIGAGFKYKNVTIDYAFTNLANQENPLYTHIFSLKLNLIKRKEN